MATIEQIEFLRKQLWDQSPAEFLKNFDQKQAGMHAILHLLFETSETVTAGMISDEMNVSTARVAVLLRKMVEKGLIRKETHALDARVTIVKLTEFGQDIAQNERDDVIRRLGAAIDKIGMDRMLEFVSISKELKAIMGDPKL